MCFHSCNGAECKGGKAMQLILEDMLPAGKCHNSQVCACLNEDLSSAHSCACVCAYMTKQPMDFWQGT